jgi:hypothetical protein
VEFGVSHTYMRVETTDRLCCVIVTASFREDGERHDMAKSIRCGAVTLGEAALLAAAGCSGSVSINQEKTVAKADVADQINTKVNEKGPGTNRNR